MEENIIKSLKEYVGFVETLPVGFELSRGQERDKELLPSVLRKDDSGMRLYSNATAHAFIEEFKINAVRYINDIYDLNEQEWIVYAQHFGVPTYLLDFTYSHLISLMFAVENAFSYTDDDESNSVVWFMNPYKLNSQSLRQQKIINLSIDTQTIKSIDAPCVVTAKKRNSRMAAQNGLFVYFPSNSDSLESLQLSDSVLRKVVIPHNCARGMLGSLYAMGMRFIDIYPELASISKDILLKNNAKEYINQGDNNHE